METEQTNDSTSKNQHPAKKVTNTKKINVLKKLDLDTAKQLQLIRDRINKKDFGRKIRDSEVIAIAMRLIGPEQILNLQQSSYTEKDRLNIAHAEFQKINGKITLDSFIGKLLKGEFKS